jgi:hypothetical protein
MGGLIDGFIAPDVPVVLSAWHNQWSSVRDETHNIVSGIEKGYLEVSE